MSYTHHILPDILTCVPDSSLQSQTESMVLQVQVYVSEMTRGAGSDQPKQQTPRANGTHREQQQQQHERSSQQQHSQQQQAHHSSRQHHQHHHQQQHHGSSHRQQPRGMGGSEGLRHRGSSAAAAAEAPVQEDPSVTPEQRKVVQQILAAKSFYDVLGVARDAGDSDIKSAYRKVGAGRCTASLAFAAYQSTVAK